MKTLNKESSVLLIIDIQEKLVKMINNEEIKNNACKISKAADILNIPQIITEQYPKGLGETIAEIKKVLKNAKYFEKTTFSALKDDEFKNILHEQNKKQIVISGIETHICVLQTAFDLLNNGYEVFVAENACGSRNENDKISALRRLRHAGIQTLTTEMILFEWLESSKNPNFKEVQALIK